MIPETLHQKLLYELLPNGNSSTQTTHLKGQLCALIDMAQLKEEKRQEISERFAGRIYPLVTEPGLEEITPLSATLIEAPATDWEGQHKLTSELDRYNSDVVSVWITSTLQTHQLAEHLRQATFIYDEQSKRYLLRYYDPFITPTLYSDAPQEWQSWFFAPIMSWVFALATPQHEQWHQLIGGRRNATGQAPKLTLTKELRDALTKDPVPYRLLNDLEQDNQIQFRDDCSGVRLAIVKEQVQEAYQQGFSDYKHLLDFVKLGHQYNIKSIIAHSNWMHVKKQALAKQGSLLELTKQYMLEKQS